MGHEAKAGISSWIFVLQLDEMEEKEGWFSLNVLEEMAELQ